MARILENAILIYTDGSLQWRGRKGGFGFAFVYVDLVGEAKVVEEHSPPGIHGTTNNRMELLACIEGLKKVVDLPQYASVHQIRVCTDSRYVRDHFATAAFEWSKRQCTPVDIWGVDLSRLTVEVTENALMIDRARSHKVLMEIRELGARISIDDFGTGYSSLAYLREIPADELKIDKSFVLNMLVNKADRKIVEQSIALGHSFDLEVVAEGVDNERVVRELIAMGCDYAQGLHFARPMAPERLADWAAGWRPGAAVPRADSAGLKS